MSARITVAATALLIALAALGGWLLLGRSARPPALSGPAQSAQIDDLRVTVQLDQAAIGERVVEVAVRDAADRPVDLRAVRLRFSMAEMDMGTIEAEAQPVGQGRYQALGPFFSMAGDWQVDATLLHDAQPARSAAFRFVIAAPGEVGGPPNPLAGNVRAALAGQQLYQNNCQTCHGSSGRGDGPTASGLNPRPADFRQHMIPGKHTDGQVYLWIRDGFPGSAMPAFRDRFSDEQIWQLVTYLRTFGRAAPAGQAQPSAQASPPPDAAPRSAVPDATEPIPPAALTRQGQIWLSDGVGQPRQLTALPDGSYAERPAFAPDGQRIAFVVLQQPPPDATEPFPTSTLYIMGADGANLQAVWQPERSLLSPPAWSPDGAALYISVNGLRPSGAGGGRLIQLVRLDLATGARQTLAEDVLDPAVSRDGARLAFLRIKPDGYTMALEVAAPDGSGARPVLDVPEFQSLYAPRFTPDGQRVVFAATGGPETDAQGRPIQPGGQTPLQRLLGLLEPASASAHGMPWDLWSVGVDGGGLRRLTSLYEDMPTASFSPDGQQILVMGTSGIYLMDADGGRLRRIDSVGSHGGIDWRP